MTPEEERISKAIEELAGFPLPQEKIDEIRVYHMEQEELADELYRSAVEDGVNFAVMSGEDDEVFVNTQWLGMIVRTVASTLHSQSEEAAAATMHLAEVLGHTILAADKFVGKKR